VLKLLGQMITRPIALVILALCIASLWHAIKTQYKASGTSA